jgi:hypothetical protein
MLLITPPEERGKAAEILRRVAGLGSAARSVYMQVSGFSIIEAMAFVEAEPEAQPDSPPIRPRAWAPAIRGVDWARIWEAAPFARELPLLRH